MSVDDIEMGSPLENTFSAPQCGFPAEFSVSSVEKDYSKARNTPRRHHPYVRPPQNLSSNKRVDVGHQSRPKPVPDTPRAAAPSSDHLPSYLSKLFEPLFNLKARFGQQYSTNPSANQNTNFGYFPGHFPVPDTSHRLPDREESLSLKIRRCNALNELEKASAAKRARRVNQPREEEGRRQADEARRIFRSSGYQQRWRQLLDAEVSGLHFTDFPWPVQGAKIRAPDEIKPALVKGFMSEMGSQQLRKELIRWHPDKFVRVKQCFVQSDQSMILEGIDEVSKILISAYRGSKET